MSLRARILTLFFGLGVVPILLLGAIGYLRSMRAVRGLLEAQTSTLAHRAAAELQGRYELRLSELLLLAENVETQRLYRVYSGRSVEPLDNARRAAELYLDQAWDHFGASYRHVELQDGSGRTLITLGDVRGEGEVPGRVSGGMEGPDAARLLVPVSDPDGGEALGTLVATVRLGSILPFDALAITFGRSGYSVILDRAGGQILHHPSRRYLNQPISELIGPERWQVDPGSLGAERGSFTYREADSTRVASFVSLQDPPWTLVSTAALDEFASPFREASRGDLLLVLLAAALVGSVFLVMIRRATRSLEALTVAAERVGKGDLAPALPPAGPDEVGRLSAAFDLMVDEIRGMLHRVEETREMAVMGEFASSISHEIRNPLTSIKLNLQSLDQEAEQEGISRDSARSLRICLREVARLDGAVHRILDMARTHPPTRVASSLHEILHGSVDLLRSQLDAQGVEVTLRLEAPKDTVLADPEDLKSVFMNLLVNAGEAMPDGGTVRLTTDNPPEEEGRGTIRIVVSDEGPGVPDDVRERIFRPFVSTKEDGTGFGLAIARVTTQEHQGRIELAAGDGFGGEVGAGGEGGATFVVELPLHDPSSEQEELE